MRAAAHVIPCTGVLRCAAAYADRALRRGPGHGSAGDGVAHAVLTTAERLEAPADVVLIAVPAGNGQGLVDRLLAQGDRALDNANARRHDSSSAGGEHKP